jgi:hypothetical protein
MKFWIVSLSVILLTAGEGCAQSDRASIIGTIRDPNRHGFSGPNTQIGTAGFGEVLPQDLNGLPGPRVGQFGARFTF